MDTKLKDLIDKKVNKIFLNSEYLKFETSDGDFTYRVGGDCCSSSYFHDFFGVEALLNGKKITEIKEVELSVPEQLIAQDALAVYGFQINFESDRWGDRTAVFSFRNSSNGYYGGYIEKVDNLEVLPEIKNDVLEVKDV